MDEELTLLNYAVVEDGVIVNTLVFDNTQTAEEFGCLPLAPHQGIGDTYVTPEEYEKQESERQLRELIEMI